MEALILDVERAFSFAQDVRVHSRRIAALIAARRSNHPAVDGDPPPR
jgi:hypothetical protein